MPANSESHMYGLPSQVVVPTQSSRMLPSSTDNQQPPQTDLYSAPVWPATPMQLAEQHNYLQPAVRPHHGPHASQAVRQQQQEQEPGQWPPVERQMSGAEAQQPPWFRQHQGQYGQMRIQHPWQHQQQLPLQQVSHQLQPGPASAAAAVNVASPWLQHTWYPSLPGGYQPPLTGQQISAGSVQQQQQQHQLPFLGLSHEHSNISHVGMQQQQQLEPPVWNTSGACSTAATVSGAARYVNPQVGAKPGADVLSRKLHLAQQQSSRRQTLGSLRDSSSALSPTAKVHKGVIKTYNLNALLT